MKYILSVNSGFAVNRYTEINEFMRYSSNYLGLNYVQLTSDILDLYMDDKYLSQKIKKINKNLKKYSLSVNSTFTGAFTRLHHLGHPDKDVQNYWINWFNWIN